MLRREFIKTASATGIAASVPLAQGQSPSSPSKKPTSRPEAPGMIYRELGTTGERVSAIGLGGAHIGGGDDAEAKIRLVRSAVDHGITFLDNCWDY
ncbi:MAG TPA: aldo/keto reductase, partial [Edaphobacter sp.]|nr:aldo/keto reductase [Edaphobacter sp.]